jgi:hypothetical protein
MCPFGCRQAHRKESSTKRSTEYYRTDEGRAKKKALNEQRRGSQEQHGCNVDQGGGDSNDTDDEKSSGQDSKTACASEAARAPETVYDEVTVHYLQTLIGLIEGRWVSMDEILAMLEKIMRQHSMGKRKRFRYNFAYPRAEIP